MVFLWFSYGLGTTIFLWKPPSSIIHHPDVRRRCARKSGAQDKTGFAFMVMTCTLLVLLFVAAMRCTDVHAVWRGGERWNDSGMGRFLSNGRMSTLYEDVYGWFLFRWENYTESIICCFFWGENSDGNVWEITKIRCELPWEQGCYDGNGR